MLQTIVDFGTREIFGLVVPLRFHGYGLMLVFGFISGIYLARWRAKRVGEDPDNITQCGILALVGGVAGARIAFVVEKWDTQFAPAKNLFVEIINITSGGLIYYGGVLLSILLVLVYLRLKGLSIRRYLDILAASAMVGLAFGRAGCLLNGCCYGAAGTTDWPLAMRFPMYSKPLIRLAGGPGPFSSGTSGPSPVYVEQLRARAVYLHNRGLQAGPHLTRIGPVPGHVSPDPRLVNQFGTSRVKVEKGDEQIGVRGLLLHPPRHLHGRLNSDQLTTMYATEAEARARFEALADRYGQLTYDRWRRATGDGDAFLRGSEHWDEALYFDDDRDGRLTFEEAWAYLQARRAWLQEMFAEEPGAAASPGGVPPTGAAVAMERANAYLQEDLFALAETSRSRPVKPAQILGIINAVVVAALLTGFYRLRRREGHVFALMLILYPITRFLLEMIRSDNRHDLMKFILTHNQYTSLLTIIVGIMFWLISAKLSAPAPATRTADGRPGPSRARRKRAGGRTRKERA